MRVTIDIFRMEWILVPPSAWADGPGRLHPQIAAKHLPMKLATLQDGSRDGLLVVVSRDLSQAHHAADVATTLQQLLDDWNFCSPPLEALYASLNAGKARHAFAFDPQQCMAPLPRGQSWVAAQAYPSHVERLCAELGLMAPPTLRERAPMQVRSSAAMCGAQRAVLWAGDGAHAQIDIEPALAVLTADLPAGSDADAATEAVRLLMVINSWVVNSWNPVDVLPSAAPSVAPEAPGDFSARLVAHIGAPGDLFLGAACSAVVVTPDELGSSWRQGRLHGSLESRVNGRLLGRCDTATGMHFDFGQLLAQLASARAWPAGSILSSGAVSVAGSCSGPDEAKQAALCVVEQRVLRSKAGMAYLKPGDTVRIEFRDEAGRSVFGVIQQQLQPRGGDVAAAQQTESAQQAEAAEPSEPSEPPEWANPAGQLQPDAAEIPEPAPAGGTE